MGLGPLSFSGRRRTGEESRQYSLRDEFLHSTCNVRLREWERLAEHDEHAPVTVRVYVPGGVPKLLEG
jgi:hypothetical protein